MTTITNMTRYPQWCKGGTHILGQSTVVESDMLNRRETMPRPENQSTVLGHKP